MPAQLETCSKCGRTIRADETPQVMNDRIVCPQCAARFGVQGLKQIGQASDGYDVAPEVQIIRNTKRYGLRQAFGILLAIAGLGGFFYARNVMGMQDDTGLIVGGACGLVSLFGLLFFIVAKIGAKRNR